MTEKETETVTVMRECPNCFGQTGTCDHDCDKACMHKKKTWCNCFGGEVEVEVEIPKSVVEKYIV